MYKMSEWTQLEPNIDYLGVRIIFFWPIWMVEWNSTLYFMFDFHSVIIKRVTSVKVFEGFISFPRGLSLSLIFKSFCSEAFIL